MNPFSKLTSELPDESLGGSGRFTPGGVQPFRPGAARCYDAGCASQVREISAMTRHIFVIQVLDPDDATLGIVPSCWRARP